VTVIRDAAGRFFASFVVKVTAEPLPETDAERGIDLGLAHFAVMDDGTKIASPKFLRRAEKKLKRTQRDLSRKQKGSKSREKARVKVARAHARVADARRDFHHKLSTRIIRENQAIVVEDLAVRASPARRWPSLCMTRAGRRLSRCWITRRSCTAGGSPRSVGSSRPARYAAYVA
jgi:putative transposase